MSQPSELDTLRRQIATIQTEHHATVTVLMAMLIALAEASPNGYALLEHRIKALALGQAATLPPTQGAEMALLLEELLGAVRIAISESTGESRN